MMKQKNLKAYFEGYKEEFLQDLEELISIDSTRGESEPGFPVGRGPAQALEKALEIAKRFGLYTENWENCLGIVQLNDSCERKLDIFAHMDVVPAGEGWQVTEPFVMKLVDGCVYGRGTADDKGPALAAIYALRAIKEQGIALAENVRLFLGCDEESGCLDLKMYRAKTKPAEMAFSPDGEFPVANIEKGSLKGALTAEFPEDKRLPRIVSVQCGSSINVIPSSAKAVIEGLTAEDLKNILNVVSEETNVDFSLEKLKGDFIGITADGEGGHASRPEQARNAATAMLQLLVRLPVAESLGFEKLQSLQEIFPHGDYYGKAAGIYMEDELSGKITVSLDILNYNGKTLTGEFDSRTPICANLENLKPIEDMAEEKGLQYEAEREEAHHVPEDTVLVKTLLKCYEAYTGFAGHCIAIGGGSYVHNMPYGVTFGCAMPGVDNRMHGPDEFADLDVLLTSGAMFASAILELCGERN
ncbi:M20 family peptidase [Emergencia sp. 1XD21-10]|nr:M20 family peptidase [Emergencia sp. 1XD21-10]